MTVALLNLLSDLTWQPLATLLCEKRQHIAARIGADLCVLYCCVMKGKRTSVSTLFLVVPLNWPTDSAGEYHIFYCFIVLLCMGRFFPFWTPKNHFTCKLLMAPSQTIYMFSLVRIWRNVNQIASIIYGLTMFFLQNNGVQSSHL